MHGRPQRRLVAGLALAIAASVPVVVVHAGRAEASPGCLSEVPQILLGFTCDDENPPITGTATGSVSGTTGSVTASASYSDADSGPISFQCRVNGGAWGACSIPGLAAGSYSIAIRAVDSADAALTPCEVILVCGAEVPDYDATPVTVSITVNPGGGGSGSTNDPDDPVVVSSDPQTIIIKAPHDRITPGTPVTLSRHPKITLTASEPATFRCAVNQHRVPCHRGVNTLQKLKPGPHVFLAQAVDLEGHFDHTPAALTFFVPYNLTPSQGKGWRSVKSHKAYAGDYVSTTRKGALLSLGSVRGVREVRLIAPVGPQLGTVAIRVGNGPWMKVRLKSAKSQKLRVFELRGAGSRRLSGVIQVKALKVPAGGAVAVDAVVAR